MSAQTNGNPPQASAAADLTGDALRDKLERRLSEACAELWDSFVDPREAYWDDDGSWLPLAMPGGRGAGFQSLFVNEQQLREIRIECRLLAATNEFAINGHENRISYLVGQGHTYRAAVRKGHAPDPGLVAEAQEVLDAFLLNSKWHRRQAEIVRRLDRDGEVFLRFFVDSAGATTVRFAEPDQVVTPPDRVDDPAASFGILTDSEDVETVRAYFVDGRSVAAADMQHRKANVDVNVKRGLPLFFPVRKNLRRADKLLRNMSVVAEIQSAIALIRKHQGGRKAAFSNSPPLRPILPSLRLVAVARLVIGDLDPGRSSTLRVESITTFPPPASMPLVMSRFCRQSCALFRAGW